ncbi:hypothetical protein COCCADRAFT_98789, partial [Bipolaris zeicola 26-R-13]
RRRRKWAVGQAVKRPTGKGNVRSRPGKDQEREMAATQTQTRRRRKCCSSGGNNNNKAHGNTSMCEASQPGVHQTYEAGLMRAMTMQMSAVVPLSCPWAWLRRGSDRASRGPARAQQKVQP